MGADLHKPRNAPRIVVVLADDAGQRIDNFLARHMKGVPRSHVYQVLRTGQVRVNRGRIRAHYRVRTGDEVRIPPYTQSAPTAAAGPEPERVAWLAQRILHRGPDLLVIDKPSGMPVHAGSGVPYGIIESLRALYPDEPALELVHRLDRETSGCLVVARSRQALRALHDALRGGRMEKRYLALVAGQWDGGKREVSMPLRRNVLQGGERMVQVEAAGKPALSRFRPVARYADSTLMEVSIVTGRTHQIRVHGAHIGHPLAGDEKYGDPAFNRRMRALGLRRMFLHAQFVSLEPAPGVRELSVSAPLDPELKALLETLETRHAD
ncbi:MAG: hypothetical protein B7Z66_09690 [Chromatiales bacterium 21-64-14]|nr:MAG: hypothetical protein B7Z66_09690 [Chromatiales bacterium 21-64-14]HQU16303.1 RluA family pseudouridine synthase [Gammaproteobacteria bacterium]